MTAPSIATPQPGLYRVRLVKGGPWCPLRIWQGFPLDPVSREPLERGWLWRAELHEEEVDVWQFWPYCAGQPLERTEYDYLLAMYRHATEHEPALPAANPRQRIDHMTTPPPF